MSRRAKQKPIERLLVAMDRCATARGNANWLNGYRARIEAGLGGGHPALNAERNQLWDREQAGWRESGEAERAFRRLAMRLLREAKGSRPSKRGGAA